MTLSDTILNVISAAISVYLSYMFIGSFALRKNKKYITDICVLIVLSFGFFLTIECVEFLFLRLILIIIITVLITFLFSMAWYNRILLPIIIYAINGVAEFAVGVTISFIFSMDMSTCLKGKYLTLGLFLSKLFVFIIFSLIRAKKHKLLSTSFQKGYFALFIIPISTFGIFLLQYNYCKEITTISTGLSFMATICYTLLLISNILVFNILDNVYNTVEKDYKIATSEKIISLQEEQYRQVFVHNKAILKIKHDQKNFLLGIMSDLDAKNYDDIRSAITREMNDINASDIPNGYNSIIYSLVKYKTDYAAGQGIKIECEYHEQQNIVISPIDLSIILGNALDNAIEATSKVSSEKEKNISVLIKTHNEQIIIIIKNPVSEKIDINNMKSSKNSEFHGFGVLSMKNLANNYGGDVVFSEDNNVFQTNIILNNNKNN